MTKLEKAETCQWLNMKINHKAAIQIYFGRLKAVQIVDREKSTGEDRFSVQNLGAALGEKWNCPIDLEQYELEEDDYVDATGPHSVYRFTYIGRLIHKPNIRVFLQIDYERE